MVVSTTTPPGSDGSRVAHRRVALLSFAVSVSIGAAAIGALFGCAASDADGTGQTDLADTTTSHATDAGGQAPIDPAGTRVCSWNMRKLGDKFDHLDKNLSVATAIITDNCDVLAVEETMNTATGHPGYDALLAALGPDWGGVVTARPRPDTTSPNSEYYAFFYRKTAAGPCSGWTAGAEYIKDPKDAFLREPAWTCLKIEGRSKELLIGAYHALYGSLAERKREIVLVADDIDGDGTTGDLVREIRASRPGADFVLVGDFNLTTSQIHDVLPTMKDLTNGNGSTLNNHDEVTTDQFDHVVMAADEPLATDFTPAEVLDVRAMAGDAGYFETVSDHLPIRFHLAPNAP